MTEQNLDDRIRAIAAEQQPTSKARAAEIAGMNSFGILEFLELTGIEPGAYGIYNIDDDGVRLGLSVDDKSLTGHQRIALRAAGDKLRELVFPCSPEDFYKWYVTTLGDNQVSDFPLATGFLDTIGKKLPSGATSNATAVPSTKIIEAFEVMPETTQNHRWWSERMRSAKKYGLLSGRAAKGSPGRGKPSDWHPLFIAAWLIDKKHLTKSKVVDAVTTHFPECDVDYL